MTRGQHIELFAGLGSASIPLVALGFETIAWAECEPFCQRVLSARFPRAVAFNDVADVSAYDLDKAMPGGQRSDPLLVSGGFPCQDTSGIGRKAGLTGARSGLWNEFARIVDDLRPEYVVIENVGGLRTRGLGTVLMDLRDLGYNARWDTIPAAAAGALHRRARVFIVAAPNYGTEPHWWDDATAYAHGNQGVWCHDHGMTFTDIPPAGQVQGKFLRALPRRFTGPYKTRFPTPRHASNEWRTTRNAPTHGNGHGKTLAGELNDTARLLMQPIGASSQSCGNINPATVEHIMGLPLGWSDPSVPNDDLNPHPGFDTPPVGPYTLSDVPNRRGRLMALGNGLVPQQFALALSMLTELSPAAVEGGTHE